MNRIIFLICILLFSFTSGIGNEIYLTRKGSIALAADPPLEVLNAVSQELKGILNSGKKSLHLSVPIRSFVGFLNDEQESDFNNYLLESHRFPEASLLAEISDDVDFKKDGSSEITAKGILSLHGVESPVEFTGMAHVLKNIVYIEATIEIHPTTHNIPLKQEIPELVIQINIKAEFEKR